MARVKLNLSTGAIEEKSVITAFIVDGKKYLILDAENVGSMGLPIILVSKIDNEKVTKIVDGNEWSEVKNYLKGIIAGNNMDYIAVANDMNADDIYYTQLTLPVASFDVIKNAYHAMDNVNVSVAPEVNDVSNQESEPIINETAPVVDIPVNNAEPEIPVANPTMPDVAPVDANAVGTEEIDLTANKQAFMNACENMFDALVEKFKTELNKK